MTRHAVKVLSVLLVVILVFLLSACGSGAPEKTTSASPGTSLQSETQSPAESSAEASPSETASPESSESASAEPSESPKPSKSSEYTTFNGYLLDQKCGVAGKDTDGNSMKTHPEMHTVKCLKNKTHAASGYGMAIRQKDGSYKFYKFDEAGSKQIKRYIVDKTEKTDEVKIAVRGTLSGKIIKIHVVLAYGLK